MTNKEMNSIVSYDDFDENVTIELNINTKFVLTDEGIRDLHDLYFDTVKRLLLDVKELQE
jgi:hypothetical protein